LKFSRQVQAHWRWFNSPEYDAVIVGAGILGLSTAYHIKRRLPEGKILVIDKLSGPGRGNTAKSAGMFRCFFYSRTNFYLADSSIEFYRHVQESGFNLGLKWIGYLWLFSEDQFKKLKPILSEMEKRGAEYRIYSREELENKLELNVKAAETEEGKFMNLENVELGLFVPKAGKIDVDRLVEYYETEFKRMGGEVRYGVTAEEIVVEPKVKLEIPGEPHFWQECRVVGVKANGKLIRAKKTIVAAGVWASKLLNPIGVDSYSKPKKRQIFVIKADREELKKLIRSKGFNKYNSMPFTILPNPRVFIKPDLDEETFWLGYADDFNRPFKLEEDPQPEDNYYRYGIYPVLTAYFPQFTGTQLINAWAGQYAINTLDHQPVVFEENSLIVVGAASGSGIMKADAIGRIAAAVYFEEEEAELYGERWFKVSDLGIKERQIEVEKFVI